MIRSKLLDLSGGIRKLNNGLQICADNNDPMETLVLMNATGKIVCRDSEECEVHLKNDEIVVLFSTDTREAFNMSRSDFDNLAI